MACLLLLGCRSQQREDSGRSYDCRCRIFDADKVAFETEVVVCAIDTGEAMAVALGCVAGEGLTTQYCDCLAAPHDFCELGSCR